jgi:hypothetical protein
MYWFFSTYSFQENNSPIRTLRGPPSRNTDNETPNFVRRLFEEEMMAKFSSPDAIMPLVKKGMAILEKTMVEEPDKSRHLMELLTSKLGQKSIDTNDFSRRLAEAGDMMSKPFSSAIDMQGKITPTEALGMLHEAILGIEDINARALAAQAETSFSNVHNAFF